MTRRYMYSLLFVFTLTLGTSLDATIIWSNCPGGNLLTGVCPIPEDAECTESIEEGQPLSWCHCNNRPQYHWEGSEEDGSCEE